MYYNFKGAKIEKKETDHMRKVVAFLVVMVLITAIIPQTMTAEDCAHSWTVATEAYVHWIAQGASGHIGKCRTFNWCSKCGLCGSYVGWKQYKGLTSHSYDNVGSKVLKSASRINNAQHVAYYTQKQQCYYCDYTRTIQISQTESHTYKNGKCTKCGAKK